MQYAAVSDSFMRRFSINFVTGHYRTIPTMS